MFRRFRLLFTAVLVAALLVPAAAAQASTSAPDATWTKATGSVATSDPVPQHITIVVSGHNVSFKATNDPTLAIHDVDVTVVDHGVTTTTHYTSGVPIKAAGTVTEVKGWAYLPYSPA